MLFSRDHRLAPEAYLYGLARTEHGSRVRAAFLNGEYSNRGWPMFFPYAFLVKTPLPLFGVLALAAVGFAVQWAHADAASRWSRLGRALYRLAPFAVLFVVYWVVAITSHLNIGHRHLLPTYPVLFVAAGGAAFWLTRSPLPRAHAALGLLTGCLLAWSGVECIRAWPDYLSYFNPIAGGSKNGYRHLVDSSLDWGQDLPGLQKWLNARVQRAGAVASVYLSYFGSGSPEFYGIHAIRLPGYLDRRPADLRPLGAGVYCISATMLQNVYSLTPGPWGARYEERYRHLQVFLQALAETRGDAEARKRLLEKAGHPDLEAVARTFEHLRFGRLCAYLRQREPDLEIGSSILIYNLSNEDVHRALEDTVPTRT
jgi:hypothetical protein